MHSKTQPNATLLDHPVVKNGLFAGLSLLGAAFSYLLYPVLAHLLTPSQFGDVGVVIALSGQLTGLLLAFNVVSIYIVHTQGEAEAMGTTAAIQKVLIQLLLAVTLVSVIAAPWLLHVLKINSLWTLVGMALLVIFAVPAVVWTGILQGHGELPRIGLYSAGIGLAKLLFATALCLAGGGVIGAVFGVLLGQIAGLWLIKRLPGTQLPPVVSTVGWLTPKDRSLVRPLGSYIFASIVVVGAYSALFAIDIVLAKLFFSSSIAGVYTGIGSLGRTTFFGTSILVWIMLANIGPGKVAESRAVLRRYLGFIAYAGFATAAGFWLLSGPIVRISLGSAYLPVAGQLWIIALSQTVAVLLYAYNLYLLVMRRGRGAVLAALVLLGGVGGASVMSSDTTHLLIGLVGGQVIGAVLYAILILIKPLAETTNR